MDSVLEIEEKAIEQLPREEFDRLRRWFEECDATVSASARVFALYDEEEGEGQQWED